VLSFLATALALSAVISVLAPDRQILPKPIFVLSPEYFGSFFSLVMIRSRASEFLTPPMISAILVTQRIALLVLGPFDGLGACAGLLATLFFSYCFLSRDLKRTPAFGYGNRPTCFGGNYLLLLEYLVCARPFLFLFDSSWELSWRNVVAIFFSTDSPRRRVGPVKELVSFRRRPPLFLAVKPFHPLIKKFLCASEFFPFCVLFFPTLQILCSSPYPGRVRFFISPLRNGYAGRDSDAARLAGAGVLCQFFFSPDFLLRFFTCSSRDPESRSVFCRHRISSLFFLVS